MGNHQLLGKGGVSGLGEERLLLKDGKESHGLLKHVNALLQIHTEVNIGPVETLPNIFLLLKGEPKRTLVKLCEQKSKVFEVHMCWLKNCWSFSLT